MRDRLAVPDQDGLTTWMRLISTCRPVSETNRPTPRRAPDKAVLLEQHERFADHGAADQRARAEVGLGGEHRAGGEQVVADGLGDPGVDGNPERRAGLGLHRLGQEPDGVLVALAAFLIACICHYRGYAFGL